MTIDDLNALAEKAKAWRPSVICYCNEDETIEHCATRNCGEADCDACLGAQRACEDIAEAVDEAALDLVQVWWCGAHGEYVQPDQVTHDERHDPRSGGCGSRVDALASRRIDVADRAARLASYFGPESNPVAEFAAAVREFCK